MEDSTHNPHERTPARFGKRHDAAAAYALRPTANDRALERFDALPNTAAVSIKVASDIAGVSISTYRRGARAGTMAPIVKLSPGRRGVIVGPLRESLRARKEVA